MSDAMAGGCGCGAIRYACTHADRDGYFCHCRMCQRAVGNVAAAFWNVRKDSVTWAGAERAYHMSSPFGRRGFCGTCGTPLSFDYPDSDRIDLTIGSLDDPSTFALTSHFGVESRLAGWTVAGDVPVMRCEDHQPLADRWAGVRGGPE
ncbi:MAG: hypothetical protein RLZZ58_565 [Pseudomonadota bacterium]